MEKKLHILFLCSWFPSRVKPTSGDFVQRHAEAVATKHKASVIHVISDENLHSGIEFTTSKENNVDIIIGYIPKTKNPFLKFYYFTKAYKKCLDHVGSFDVTHLNVTYPKGIVALFLKWFKNKPYIISEHWTGYQPPLNKNIGILRKKISQIVIKNAAFVCPVSKDLENAMTQFGLKGNYKPVPNVVLPPFFATCKERNTDKFTITHISHMRNEHKNVIGILNTIKSLQQDIPNLKFNLIGENSDQYLKYIQKLKINNTRIIDQVPNDEIPSYLSQSNIFVLFSNYENLPCVILESFACNTPVISTNVGGISEYFPDGFGSLINVKDENALRTAILKIYTSENKIEENKMQEYAKKNFSFEAISSAFSNLYYKALK